MILNDEHHTEFSSVAQVFCTVATCVYGCAFPCWVRCDKDVLSFRITYVTFIGGSKTATSASSVVEAATTKYVSVCIDLVCTQQYTEGVM